MAIRGPAPAALRESLRRLVGLTVGPSPKRRKRARPGLYTTEQVQKRLELAEQILAAPPAEPWIRRVEPVGRLVAQFVLPLSLLKSANELAQASLHIARRSSKLTARGTRRGMVSWQLGELKERTYQAMLVQVRNRRARPLAGRPMVLCTRFSAREPDHSVGGFKIAIDRLKVGSGGLGLLVDDAPRYCDDHQWWEKLPKSSGIGRGGFGLIRVYTGART